MIGYSVSHHTLRAQEIAMAIAKTKPDVYETWWHFGSRFSKGWYRNTETGLLSTVLGELNEEDQAKFKEHTSSPFCWLEMSGGAKKGLGGRDGLAAWASENFKSSDEVVGLSKDAEPPKSRIRVLPVRGTAVVLSASAEKGPRYKT